MLPVPQIKSASRIAHEFATALEKTLAARKEMGRNKPPRVVYTTEEWKQLKEYAGFRELPERDERAAARLQAGPVLAGAELKDTLEKAEAFNASKHFWKFDLEGWERRVSLKEIEQALKVRRKNAVRQPNQTGV